MEMSRKRADVEGVPKVWVNLTFRRWEMLGSFLAEFL
jgi:hypothetical protein